MSSHSESQYLEGQMSSLREEAAQMVQGVKERMTRFADCLMEQHRRSSSGSAMLRDLNISASSDANSSSARQAFEAVVVVVQTYMIKFSDWVSVQGVLAMVGVAFLLLFFTSWCCGELFEDCGTENASFWCYLTNEEICEP